MDIFLQDLRYALRQLGRNPGFALVAVLTLALGIGATTAMFGAIDAVLLKPLPYPNADRVLTLWQHHRGEGVARGEVAPANFLDWRERSSSFEALAAVEPYSVAYLAPEAAGPESIPAWKVSKGFFEVLGVPAFIGRTFRADEYDTGGAGVAVLGHRIWQSRFGGDANIVGKTLILGGEAATIVGVMPPAFDYPAGRQVWVPRVFADWEQDNRGSAWWQVVGRLKAGVGVGTARAELDAIATQLEREYPQTNTHSGISVVPLPEQLVGHVRPALLLLFAAVGLVLLIACVNVANLLLARGINREHEFAIRAALGASRGRVIRQLITESVLLAGLGSLAGLAIAAWGLKVFQTVAADNFPRIETLGVDGRMVAFTLLTAFATVLLFSLIPALHTARAELRMRLQPMSQSATKGARGLRNGLVIAELALAMMLLVGAGLLVRSFVALLEVERGYRADNVLVVQVQTRQYYPTSDQRALFVQQTLERIAALPGVEAAGVTSSLPLAESVGDDRATFAIESRPAPAPGQEPSAHTVVVTHGFFSALAIPLRRGRLFEPADDADTPPVVLINETMAARYWPGADPLGGRIVYEFGGQAATAEIIGVVGDVRHAGPDEEPRPTLFLPHVQAPAGAFWFTARTANDPASLTRAVQNEIWAMNPAMPIREHTTLDALLADSLRERRFNLLLLLSFSLTALALAAVGTYGLLSYEASRRTREIGIRIALGAERSDVLRLVVGQGVKLVLIGVALGAGLALATTRVLSGLLFGISPFDPLTFVSIALLLIAVTAIASYLPAQRATRVEPMIALRAE